jgi:hypothetical protein
MSFGFGVSDFITVIELANKLRREFVAAPSQFKNIANEYVDRRAIRLMTDMFLAESEASPSFFRMLTLSYLSMSRTNNK